jgi:hypothetical protein
MGGVIKMDSETGQERAATPVHLWIVGVLALAWNAIGVTDYVMLRSHNTAYLQTVMPNVDSRIALAWVDAMPLLAGIAWALGVWGALAGTLLLLARSRHAVPAYLVSLAGAVITFAFQFAGPPPPAGMDDKIVPVIVTIIALGLLLYARAMKARGVLR